MIELNTVYNENCLDTMKRMPDGFLDLTVTSPPYDNLRTYNGYCFPFEDIAKELYRVTKEGGVVVWNVADATIKGSETGTSFRQALYFMSIGFNLHDTMIFAKRAVGACGSMYCYQQAFEYMFVFTKGKLKTFNPIKDLVPQDAGKLTKYAKTKSDKTGYLNEKKLKVVPRASKRQNIWVYDIGYVANNNKTKHPAVFPEQLAHDHILSWSNENDIVYDCFGGSGTTAKMAKALNRNYILSEISSEYCEIIHQRLTDTQQLKLIA